MFREAMDRDLADLTSLLQEMADMMPAEGSDGRGASAFFTRLI